MTLDNKTINFDINRNNLFNLTAKQYDTNGARSFTFRLLKNSIPFDLTGLSVKVGGKKPDGKDIFNDCTIKDAKKGIVELELTTQMQVVAGTLNLELIILKGETRLSTVPFEVQIIQGATCYSAIQSSDEFKALQDALWKTDNVYDKSEINNFIWGMSNMGQDVKEAMSDGNVAVVGKNTILEENIIDGQVTQVKTNFLKVKSKNLYNYKDARSQSRINYENGELVPFEYHFASGWIKVEGGESYSCNNLTGGLAFYTIDRTFISGLNNPQGLINTPSNCGYIRFSSNSTNGVVLKDIMFNKGELLPFEEFKYGLDNSDYIDEKFIGEYSKNIRKGNLAFYFESEKNYINVDINTSKIIMPSGIYYFYSDWKYNKAQMKLEKELVLNYEAGNNIKLVFDFVSKTFKAVPVSSDNYGDEIVVLSVWNTSAFSPLGIPFKINGVLSPCGLGENSITPNKLTPIPLSKIDKNELTNFINGDFNELKHRLLAPPMMYFIDGDSVPLYSTGLLYTPTYNSYIKLLVESSIKPYYKYLDTMELITPEMLSDEFKIGIELGVVNPHLAPYYSKVIKNSVSKDKHSGKTIKYLALGDSITNREVAKFTKEKLKQRHNVECNCVGTMDNFGVNGEGREGWEFANFVGADNTYGFDENNQIIKIQQNGEETNLLKNPFLRLATDIDKRDNPHWCFTRNEIGKEISYAKSENKNQDFYIFDFKHYLDTFKIEKPDVVTIALGRNDLSQIKDYEGENRQVYLDKMKTYLEIITTQVRKALPNCKIGVVPDVYVKEDEIIDPIPNFGNLANADWIEQCIVKIKELNEKLGEIYCIPAWCSINNKWSLAVTEEQLIAGNSEIKTSYTDYIHLVGNGRQEYTDVMTNFIMNVIE